MNRIAELRLKKGLSQKAFGKAIGAAQNTVCNWENGNRQPDNEKLTIIANYFNVSVDYLLGNTQKNNASENKGVKIPVLGDIAAGIPITAIQDIIDYEEITEEMAATGEFFALRVNGDSMEPKISKGDVVIVRQQSDCDNGDTAVVLINGDTATLKRIKKRPEGIMLVSTNPNYEPMFYSNREINDLPVIVLGKVVELRAKF